MKAASCFSKPENTNAICKFEWICKIDIVRHISLGFAQSCIHKCGCRIKKFLTF